MKPVHFSIIARTWLERIPASLSKRRAIGSWLIPIVQHHQGDNFSRFADLPWHKEEQVAPRELSKL
jgi:hypothetical protein